MDTSPPKSSFSIQKGEKGISYDFEINSNIDLADILKSIFNKNSHLYSQNTPKNRKYHILHVRGFTRVEDLKNNKIILLDPNQKLTYINTFNKFYSVLNIDKEECSLKRTWEYEISDKSKSIKISDSEKEIIYQYEFTTNDDFKDYYHLVINFIFYFFSNTNKDNKLIERLSQYGMPVTGEMKYSPRHEDGIVKSEYRFTIFQIITIDPELFSIPTDYSKFYEFLKNRQKKPEFTDEGKKIRVKDRPFIKEIKTQSSLKNSRPKSYPNIPCPLCTSATTYESYYYSHIEEQLFQDIGYLINAISMRMNTIEAKKSGSEGILTINWLQDLKKYSSRLDDGDGLYYLLTNIFDDDTGLLHYFAKVAVIKLIKKGQITAPEYHNLFSHLPSQEIREFHEIMNDPSIEAKNRLFNLEQKTWWPAFLTQIVTNYVFLIIGTKIFSYPTDVSTFTDDREIIKAKFYDLEFNINLNYTKILEYSTITILPYPLSGNFGVIELKIPKIEGFMKSKVTVDTKKLRKILEIASIIEPIGGLHTLFLVAQIESFIEEMREFHFDVTDLILNFRLQFDERSIDDERKKALFIECDCHYDSNDMHIHKEVGDITLIDPIVDGINEALFLCYVAAFVKYSNWITSKISKILTEQLQQFIDENVGSIPPSLKQLEIDSIYSGKYSKSGEYIGYKARFFTEFLPFGFPYLTQVNSSVIEILTGYSRSDFQNSSLEARFRHYGGFSISQNLLNLIGYKTWQKQTLYFYKFTAHDIATLKEKYNFTEWGYGENFPDKLSIWAASSPRTMVTPRKSQAESLISSFDDVRICFGDTIFDLKDWTDEMTTNMMMKFSCKLRSHVYFGTVENGLIDRSDEDKDFISIRFDLAKIEIYQPEIQEFFSKSAAYCVDLEKIPQIKDFCIDLVKKMLEGVSCETIVPFESRSFYRYPISKNIPKEIIALDMKPYVRDGNIYLQYGLSGFVGSFCFPGNSWHWDLSVTDINNVYYYSGEKIKRMFGEWISSYLDDE